MLCASALISGCSACASACWAMLIAPAWCGIIIWRNMRSKSALAPIICRIWSRFIIPAPIMPLPIMPGIAPAAHLVDLALLRGDDPLCQVAQLRPRRVGDHHLRRYHRALMVHDHLVEE